MAVQLQTVVGILALVLGNTPQLALPAFHTAMNEWFDLDHSQPTDCSPRVLSADRFWAGLWMLAFEDGTECQVDKTDLKKVRGRAVVDGFSLDCLSTAYGPLIDH